MNKKQCSLDSLPFEIVEQILLYDVVSYIDVCRFSSVSQLCKCISKSNKLWCIKYEQTFPVIKNMFDCVSTDWKNEFRRRISYKKAIHCKLTEMTQEFHHLDNVSNDSFHNFKSLCENNPFTDFILVEELNRILNGSDSHLHLTMKYYAEKALIYVRRTMLDTTWRTFLAVEKRPSLLKGACLIQQWCQPSMMDCTKDISNKINKLTEEVLNEIKEAYPDHPIIKQGFALVHDKKVECLEKSLWRPYHCKVILECLSNVLFRKLGWSSVEYSEEYTFENIYIDQVIDKNVGIPVTLGIIYETIARQLGVHLLPVNFPGHFLLKWLEHPENNENARAWTYIDIFDSGVFKKENELGDLAPGIENLSHSWLDPVPPVKVFARICWNLVEVGRQHEEGGGRSCLCNSLELLSILCPDDMEHKLLLARVYMHLRINITRVISLLQEIAEHDPASTGIVGSLYRSAITQMETQKIKKESRRIRCQPRTEERAEVKFAVGMLMTHKEYNYRCVIYGWDPICIATKNWKLQMGVNKLRNKEKQPFYHVLVSDGTNCYAAEENLLIDVENEPINHMEIGRYFESFHGSYYLPNEQKRREYPDDSEACQWLLSLPKVSNSVQVHEVSNSVQLPRMAKKIKIT